ncbi:MAG: RdgB/HAM1 family non-canonical purine NTP pyrophosphatase [Lachnospiraceae bacterium]|nr:RdgB/HAM1 family non-canonical purine NTP pyrophosphatase [Lachnospiraceae bacterium]
MRRIVLASRNRHKIREMEVLLHTLLPEEDFVLLSLDDIGYTGEIEEDGTTFEENAKIKASVPASLGYIGIADDSGLEVDALNGEPGVYSARYADEEGVPHSDEANNDKLLRKLASVPDEKRTARFVSCLSLVTPCGRSFTVRGTCEGVMLWERRGTGGFGYDPLFYHPPLGKTFAELTPEEKNSVSHRAHAAILFAEEWRRFFAHG